MQTRKAPISFILLAALLVGTAPSARSATVTSVQKASESRSKFDGAIYKGESVSIDEPLPGLDTYRVFEKAATGFSSVQGVREEVQDIADKFCKRKNAAARSVSERHSTPPHVLGNFPRVELLFQCVPATTPSATPAQQPPDKYERIAALKKLLDSGALTQEEFETEKAKILASP